MTEEKKKVTGELTEEEKKEQPQSDVYYKTECEMEDSKVAVPTEDAVEEAKEWVDDENRK